MSALLLQSPVNPHWVNVFERLPEENRELYLLVVGPDKSGARDIEYAKGKWTSRGWVFTDTPTHSFIVAWLEDAGRTLTMEKVSAVAKDSIRFQ